MEKNNNHRKTRDQIILTTAVAVALALGGCFYIPPPRTGPTQTETLSVPAGAAKSVSVHLKIATGELHISGGAQKLMTGTISYNVPDWKPDLSYSVNASRGMLMLMQPEQGGIHSNYGNVKYDWNLQFSNDVPLDIAVEMGAGKSELNLGGLDLENFSMEAGAGQATVDMSGAWKKNLSATFQAGVGELHLKLPREVGVRVSVEGGLGSVDAPDFNRDGSAYVNGAFGKSPITLDVRIEGGIGSVRLELVGARGIA